MCLNVFSLFSTAIFNEQQAGNCNVAVTSLHCLLLHNVYITNFGVSSLGDSVWQVGRLTAAHCSHTLFLSSSLKRCQNICDSLCFADPMQQLTSISEPCWRTPSPVPFACIKGFHAFSWTELSWPRLFRRIAAITCCTHSSWSTPTPSQVSFHLQITEKR